MKRAVVAGALCLQALGWPTRSQEVVAPASVTSPDAIAAFGSVPLWKYHQSLELPSVAACISGPYLTLASGIVQANFERHVVAPLGRSNMDLYGAFELQNRTASDRALLSMTTALNLVAWVSYSPQSRRPPCGQFKIGAARKTAAYGMAECAKVRAGTICVNLTVSDCDEMNLRTTPSSPCSRPCPTRSGRRSGRA